MSDSIWQWVNELIWDLEENDQAEIARKIDNFSELAFESDITAVEAAFPELLAFARQQKNAWLEVFLRHWRLQAYVGTPMDPRPLVPEALELLAFAHGEDAVDCPQRICVTDDLDSIYASIDARGYAPDRLQMLDEQLADTPLTRECYMCLTIAKIDALLDLDDPKAALNCWEEALKNSTAVADSIKYGSHYYDYQAPSIALALLGIGRAAESLDILEKCNTPTPQEASALDFIRAEVHLALGAGVDAKECFARAAKVKDDDIDIRRLIEAARPMRDKGLLEDWAQLAGRLLRLAEFSETRGRVCEAFDSAALAFSLAAQEKDRGLAKAAIDRMQSVVKARPRREEADQELADAVAAYSSLG